MVEFLHWWLRMQAMVVRRTVSANQTESLERVAAGDTVCHYLHKSEDIVASLDLCDETDIHGLVISNNRSIEIMPLLPRLKRMLDMWNDDKKENENTDGTTERGRESKSLFQKRNYHIAKRMDHEHTVKFDKILKQGLDGDFDDDIVRFY